jgi:TorA maturation chaperone TorD
MMNTQCDPDFLVLAESYKILALLYNKPSKGVHDNRKIYDSLVKSAGQINQKALEVAKRLRKTGNELELEEQTVEYSRLFEKTDDNLPSLLSNRYIGNLRQDQDDSLKNWLTEIYHKAGFDTSLFDDPVDHISVELFFIHHLLINAAKGLKEDDMSIINHFGELRCIFVNEHMVKWVPEFTRCILTNSKSPYYLQLAILTRTTIINCPGENIQA